MSYDSDSAGGNVKALSGKCWTKCPAYERKFREQNKLLSFFEVVEGTENLPRPKGDPHKCVKEFRRSAAGEVLNDPASLRPGKVLIQTVNYLFKDVLSRDDVPFTMIYDFVFDRLRSVRQDLVIQQIQVWDLQTALKILEKCCCFYMYSIYMAKMANSVSIDMHINKMHMMECLNTLLSWYWTDMKQRPYPCLEITPNCIELSSCYLMCNIHSPGSLTFLLRRFSKELREIEPLKTAIKISLCHLNRNYIRIFKLFSMLGIHAYPWFSLSLLSVIEKYRSEVVSVLSVSHKSKKLGVPAQSLTRWLILKGASDVIDLCHQYSLLVDNDSVVFNSSQLKNPERVIISNESMFALSRSDLLKRLL